MPTKKSDDEFVDDDSLRNKLMMAAFHEVYQNGYQGTGLQQILDRAETTKGALYHHFKSKKDLVLKAYDEFGGYFIQEYWVKPLEAGRDALKTIARQSETIQKEISLGDLTIGVQYGCPLNNMIQEMSPLDEEFYEMLLKYYLKWVKAVETAIRRDMKSGIIKTGIDSNEVANFIVSAIEGCISNGKVYNDKKSLKSCLKQLRIYLDSLRST